MIHVRTSIAAILTSLLFALAYCAEHQPVDEELKRRRLVLGSAGSLKNSTEQRAPSAPATARPVLELLLAAGDGNLEQLRQILDTVSLDQINAPSAGGETALTHAVWFRQVESVAILLQSGANPHVFTDGGETPLHYAIRRDQPEIVALLLNAGVDLNAADRQGFTPLMVAAGLGRQAITERLLQLKVPATTRDTTEEGRTALLHAIRGGHSEVARLLISKKTVKQADKFQETALYYAIRKDDFATLDALLKKGAQVDARNRYGETPLMAAAFFGRTEFVRRLLAAGANPRLRDEHKVYDAALVARTGGHETIAELLEAPWWMRLWL